MRRHKPHNTHLYSYAHIMLDPPLYCRMLSHLAKNKGFQKYARWLIVEKVDDYPFGYGVAR